MEILSERYQVFKERMNILKRNSAGFTLIEVMITAVVLAFGVLAVYNAFFLSLNGLNYYSDYLRVFPLLDEVFWQARNAISRQGKLENSASRGEFRTGNRNVFWNIAYALEDEVNAASSLYKVDLKVSFNAARGQVNLSRTGYALYEPVK